VRFCSGAPNGAGENLEPRLRRVFQSSNAPAADEPVEFRVEVRDDKLPIASEEPTEDNIETVQIVYSVDGGADQSVEMTMISLENGSEIDMKTGLEVGRPNDIWSLWTGEIPGQPAGSQVEL